MNSRGADKSFHIVNNYLRSMKFRDHERIESNIEASSTMKNFSQMAYRDVISHLFQPREIVANVTKYLASHHV